ncbi:MAG: ATP-binding cassette domain-containing protein [Chloroflexota bacterium]
MLEIKNLMVFFENALAVNDLSMEVKKGEIVGVLGSNSAGKSTLMNTISGLIIDMKIKEQRRGGERITILGKITFEGEDILYAKPSYRVKKGIVLARERHPVFGESSVMENLRIAGYLRKYAEVREAIDFVFETFPRLKEIKDRRGGLLSGGEQQMLIIGMTLVARPRLLLLDEPLLGLAPALQADLMKAVKQIRDSMGVTILVTEQFARPLLPIIDRGYVVENGMLCLAGSRDELMNNPEVISAYFGV